MKGVKAIEMNQQIFNQYNKESDVVRCPYGRASVRDLLDLYAKAAVNLYGVISQEDLVEIFNKQNTDQTNVEEIYIMLLPLVLKESWYCFYKDYIVHQAFFMDFSRVDITLAQQADKPRYVPPKNKFLKYTNEAYFNDESMKELYGFMPKVFGYSMDTLNASDELAYHIRFGDGISELQYLIANYNLIIDNEGQIQELVDLIVKTQNNSRMWQNKGHTPNELSNFRKKTQAPKRNTASPQFASTKKVGRNEPCPCGSGKKFKKCCGLYDHTQNAQLNAAEVKLFYDIWYGLLGYVNEERQVFSDVLKISYPEIDEEITFKLREVLWEEPELITDYIASTELSQETIEILISWRDNHKAGMFFMVDQQPGLALLLGSDEEGEDLLYGVKGISRSISTIIQRPLPCVLEAILLPFKGKIIYDSFLNSYPIDYGAGAVKTLEEMHQGALKSGITTSLL